MDTSESKKEPDVMVRFKTDYESDWHGAMRQFKEGEIVEIPAERTETWIKRGIVEAVSGNGEHAILKVDDEASAMDLDVPKEEKTVRWTKDQSRFEVEISPEKLPKSKAKFNQEKTDSIEWSQWSWNPVVGCRGPKDEGPCTYCYALDIYNRLKKDSLYAGKPFTEPTFHPERLDAPENTPLPDNLEDRHVFVGSMTDLFGNSIPQNWIDSVLAKVRDHPEWTFIFLTKNPKRLVGIDWPANAWVGTTVDVQSRVLDAEAAFREVKASVKFLSCEPLEEPVTFGDLSMFNWMIIGGRSRNSKLPEFKPPKEWIDSLVQSARATGLKIYEKPNLGVEEAVRLRENPTSRAEYQLQTGYLAKVAT